MKGSAVTIAISYFDVGIANPHLPELRFHTIISTEHNPKSNIKSSRTSQLLEYVA